MILRTLVLTAFVWALLSCNSNYSSQTTSIKSDTLNQTLPKQQADIQQKVKEQYAAIDRIFQKDDTTFLDADYIQYLTGDAAIEAAKKAHEADTFKTEDGVTHIDVPNDYFILNESRKIRRLTLAKDCVFDLIINPDRTNVIKDNSLSSLKKIYSDSPFILTLKDKEVVVKIQEVFLP